MYSVQIYLFFTALCESLNLTSEFQEPLAEYVEASLAAEEKQQIAFLTTDARVVQALTGAYNFDIVEYVFQRHVGVYCNNLIVTILASHYRLSAKSNNLYSLSSCFLIVTEMGAVLLLLSCKSTTINTATQMKNMASKMDAREMEDMPIYTLNIPRSHKILQVSIHMQQHTFPNIDGYILETHAW